MLVHATVWVKQSIICTFASPVVLRSFVCFAKEQRLSNFMVHLVDGSYPAPTWDVSNPINSGINYQAEKLVRLPDSFQFPSVGKQPPTSPFKQVNSSHKQDYEPFLAGNPNLNHHLWLAFWVGGRPRWYIYIYISMVHDLKHFFSQWNSWLHHIEISISGSLLSKKCPGKELPQVVVLNNFSAPLDLPKKNYTAFRKLGYWANYYLRLKNCRTKLSTPNPVLIANKIR